jgi:hypothetical protein
VNLSSLQFEEVTSEAVERIIRAKNVIIYGVPESSGTAEQRQTKDAAEIQKIISAITPEAIPQKIICIGKPNSSNTRPLKVSLSNDLIAKEVLRNKNKLINSDLPRSISISDDKTPKQLEYLKNLRTELQLRRDNGEDNITILICERNSFYYRVKKVETAVVEWSLMYTNLASLMAKIDDLILFVQLHKPAFLLITETFLSSQQ